jgi:hypothetical protein
MRGVPWIVGGSLIAAAIALWGFGSIEAATAAYAAIGLIVVSGIGYRISTLDDKSWLPTVVSLAYLVKLMSSATRWGVLEFVYNGSGDATGYHGSGNRLVATWRAFGVPDVEIGTEFVNAATAFLYIPYVPSKLGGFFVFATLAFFGQMLLYAAFRVSADPARLRWYAAAIFFLPTIVYWPSSIGKESLMYLFFGIAGYGAAMLLYNYRLRWAALFAVGVTGSAAVRPHVALLLVLALVAALLLAKRRTGEGLGGRRIAATAAIGLVLVAAGAVAAANFNIDLESGFDAREDLETVISNVEGSTSTGGSVIVGSAIRSPLEFPSGFVKVLFRPFPHEANNALALLSSIEGVILLGLFLWRFIPMLRNGRHIRSNPYMIFALVFTIGFVIAFSAFNNFGLLARQRSQVMPFFIALLITYGWSTRSSPDAPQDEPEPTAVHSA